MGLFDLFVLPSLEEGLSTALLAAMASRLAVVASDAGGIPDAVTNECGILVPPGDERALAGGIVELMNDSGARAAMENAAATRARDFDVSSMAERTLALYRSVLEAR
jgi:glycosyltransferase involved in cell wall biosynthesis